MFLRRAFVAIVAAGCSTPPPDDVIVDSGVDSNGPVEAATDSGYIPDNPPGFWDSGNVEVPSEPTAPPVFDPPKGTTNTKPFAVTITSATKGATIYYTTDGTNPNTSSAKYTTPINVTSGMLTIKAMALAPGFLQSEIVAATYIVTVGGLTIEPVTFSPPGGSYTTDQNVTLSTLTMGATICYTLDGSDPNCDEEKGVCALGTTYAGPVAVTPNAAGRVITATACKPWSVRAAITRATYKTP